MKKMTEYTPKSNIKTPEGTDFSRNYRPGHTFNPRPSPSMRVFGYTAGDVPEQYLDDKIEIEEIDLSHNYRPGHTLNYRPSPSMRVFGGD